MDITVTELGIFSDKDYTSNIYTPCKNYDMTGSKLWLYRVQHIEDKLLRVNSSKADILENYNLWFCINDGSDRKKYNAVKTSLVLNITVISECFPNEEPEDVIIEGLKDALSIYPILFIQEVLDAFASRQYYRNAKNVVLKLGKKCR